ILRRRGVFLGERSLEPEHVVGTPLREHSDVAGGDSLVAHPRGCRPRSGYVAGNTRPGWPQPYRLVTGNAPYDARNWSMKRGDLRQCWRSDAASAGRDDPGLARVLPVQGPGGARHLCRQGQVVAVAAVELL